MSRRQDREKKRREDAKEHRKREAFRTQEKLTAAVEKAKHTADKARLEYVKEWSPNSQMHFEQGHYEWLASQIKDYKKVLEIGCGVGHSTLVLISAGHTVVRRG